MSRLECLPGNLSLRESVCGGRGGEERESGKGEREDRGRDREERDREEGRERGGGTECDVLRPVNQYGYNRKKETDRQTRERETETERQRERENKKELYSQSLCVKTRYLDKTFWQDTTRV